MVGEIFQEIYFFLSFVAILVCLFTTILVFVPCSDEVFSKRRSNTVADSADNEKLCVRDHRNFQGIRDLGEGKDVIGLSEEMKSANLESANISGDYNELFYGVLEERKVEETMHVDEVLDELSERPPLSSSKIKEEQESSVDEKTHLSYNSGHEDGVTEAKIQKGSENSETDELNTERAGYHEEEEEEEQGFLFDDWEGIEKTELERLFGKAVAFVSSNNNSDLLDSNLKLQLHGLHKIATEGPCHESPPIPLKLSARAKWNAWQRLGAMNMDMAMEQYMILLSKFIPDWEVEEGEKEKEER